MNDNNFWVTVNIIIFCLTFCICTGMVTSCAEKHGICLEKKNEKS